MATKVLVVAHQKGGIGKTCVTMQLSGTLGRRGAKVIVVDMDSQGTATRWANLASDDQMFPARVIPLADVGRNVVREIKKYIEDYSPDFIIVDCPPSVESQAAQFAMLVADLALIPVKPAPGDMWATERIKALIEQVRVTNETLEARIVPNMFKISTNLSKDILELIREDPDISPTRTVLGDRTAYSECMLVGSTVHAMPGDGKAVEEVEALTDEVLEILGVKGYGRKS